MLTGGALCLLGGCLWAAGSAGVGYLIWLGR